MQNKNKKRSFIFLSKATLRKVNSSQGNEAGVRLAYCHKINKTRKNPISENPTKGTAPGCVNFKTRWR